MTQLTLPLQVPTYQLMVEIDQHEDNGLTFYEEYLVGEFQDKQEAYDHCDTLNSLGTPRGREYKIVVVWAPIVLGEGHEHTTNRG